MKSLFCLTAILCLWVHAIYSQTHKLDTIAFPYLGQLKPRHASEIVSSNWSIGGETLDRDLTLFSEWKSYVGPLGAKKMRLQAGWAKCEQQRGVYDFAWLDEVVDGLLAQGVSPWLQTAYGNPIYPKGGGIHLNAGFPGSDQALQAWDAWMRTMARRYRHKVKVWEVWNEPEKHDVNDYAALYIRTATIIREVVPNARIYALSLAKIQHTDYLANFLEILHRQNKLHLVVYF